MHFLHTNRLWNWCKSGVSWKLYFSHIQTSCYFSNQDFFFQFYVISILEGTHWSKSFLEYQPWLKCIKCIHVVLANTEIVSNTESSPVGQNPWNQRKGHQKLIDLFFSNCKCNGRGLTAAPNLIPYGFRLLAWGC